MIFVIHGDGGYVYHDEQGVELKADVEMLRRARSVAESNRNSEVFIFHQKSKTHFMLFFPRDDGDFYYYRNGRLLAQSTYDRFSGNARFDAEARMVKNYRQVSAPDSAKNLFLYFGHEVPEINDGEYDDSHGESRFTVDTLANGMKQFTSAVGATQFGITVLSTCYNGTPGVVSSLAPFTKYLIEN